MTIEFIYQQTQPGMIPYDRPIFFYDGWLNPYNYPAFDDCSRTPFFIFYSDGKLIAAAHLSWSEMDGDNGACVRFTAKYRKAKVNKILCFDPLLTFTVIDELIREEAAA